MLALFLAWNGYFLAFELAARGDAGQAPCADPRRRAPHDGGGADGAGGGAGGGTGARLTAEAVIARNLLRDIELFLPIMFFAIAPTGETGAAGIAAMAWFAVFAFLPLFNRDGLRAGDMIAGTWVVESPRAALPETLSTAGAAAGASVVTGAKYRFGEAELAVYGEYELQMLERVLREDRAEAIASGARKRSAARSAGARARATSARSSRPITRSCARGWRAGCASASARRTSSARAEPVRPASGYLMFSTWRSWLPSTWRNFARPPDAASICALLILTCARIVAERFSPSMPSGRSR